MNYKGYEIRIYEQRFYGSKQFNWYEVTSPTGFKANFSKYPTLYESIDGLRIIDEIIKETTRRENLK